VTKYSTPETQAEQFNRLLDKLQDMDRALAGARANPSSYTSDQVKGLADRRSAVAAEISKLSLRLRPGDLEAARERVQARNAEEQAAGTAMLAAQQRREAERLEDERLQREQAAVRSGRVAALQRLPHGAFAAAALLMGAASDKSENDWVLGDYFECAKCGRWADTEGAVRSLGETVSFVGLDIGYLSQLEPGPMTVARLQRERGLSYEDATVTLERAIKSGIFHKLYGATILVSGLRRCDVCLSAARQSATVTRSPDRDPIPAQLRFRVLQRDGFRCQYCGRSARDGAVLHVDHVVPVAAGGETNEGNLIAACDQCNLGKSATALQGL
jgi:Restriction endonuclease